MPMSSTSVARVALHSCCVAVAMLAAFVAPAQAQVITTVAGNGGYASGDGGPATAAGLGSPTAVATIPGGGFYIATDTDVRRVDAAGVITRIAGSATTAGYAGDGGPATAALFLGIQSLALDTAGNLYIVDSENARVRRIGTDGIITTVAGNGMNLFSAEPGPATERPLRFPHAVAVGPDGSLYIADHSSIRKVGTDGVMTRIAGDGSIGFAGDFGAATAAKLNAPNGLAVKADGIVYVADRGNSRLRKISATGIISTVPTELAPRGLAITADGLRLFYTVPDQNQIATVYREIIGGLVAGTGVAGFTGDGGGPLAARISAPVAVAVDAEGRLYIADSGNHRIRRVDFNAVDPAPIVFFNDPIFVVEGDSGTREVAMEWTLSEAAAGPTSFMVETRAAIPGGSALPADAGIDYVAVPPTRIDIAAGQTSGSIPFTIIGDRNIEPDQRFEVWVSEFTGVRASTASDVASLSVIITNDDVAAPTPLIVRHDQFVVRVDSATNTLSPTGNDTYDFEQMRGGSFTLVTAPEHGTAVVVADTSPEQNPVNGRVEYTPAPGFAGTDRFRYRLCTTAGECGEAMVEVFLRLAEERQIGTSGRMGQDDGIYFGGPQALQELAYAATPLVAPSRFELSVDADFTPGDPWDSDAGTGFRLYMLPAVTGAPVTRRVVAEPSAFEFTRVDVLVGVDTNGNGRPDAAELACRAGSQGNPSCEMEVVQGASGVSYWVMAHSRTGDFAKVDMAVFDIPLVAGNGTLVATGPGNVLAVDSGRLRISWRDDGFLADESRMGYVRTTRSGGVAAGDVRVRLYRNGFDQEKAIQLVPGKPLALRLSPQSTHDRIYFDVPANATRVTIASQSASEIDFSVIRHMFPVDPRVIDVAAASGGTPAAVVADAPGGTQSVQIPGTPQAGRWYVVPGNTSDTAADLTLTVTIEAQAPVVRSGSYFNPARPGSGVFLYPAGNQLAGIWYTYDDSRRPTWYYLQGLAPDATGIWRADLYRGTWHGSAGYLTAVGQVVATPTGSDQFTLGYQLDGTAGTQPMASLGRGCPTLAGQDVDTSSNWFDAASAGRGYSLQTWPNYELHAAFVYDMRGRPLYLLAERSSFGGNEATLAAEYLEGSSPTESYFPSQRTTVGTLVRRIVGGKLQRIELDAVYSDPAEGTPSFWSSVDTLQLLGGAGTTQGCQP